jgi:hypothetical protein
MAIVHEHVLRGASTPPAPIAGGGVEASGDESGVPPTSSFVAHADVGAETVSRLVAFWRAKYGL